MQRGRPGPDEPGAEEVLHQDDELREEGVCGSAQHAGEESQRGG